VIILNAKQIAEKQNRFVSGHRMCAGCGIPTIVNQVLASVDNVVVACATGCLEVASTIYPFTAWNVPFIHNAFENAAATISGVETAYKVLKKKNKIKDDIKFLAFGGDGGSFDIGLQSLSGALERGHDFVYICYSNEGYMNTGNQRSSATPYGASTTTTPAGKVIPGKIQFRKNLTEICAAHKIPYVGQTSAHAYWDLTEKVRKAFANTPAVIVVLQPCPTNWGFNSDMTVQISKLAADTCFWPLYEIEHGKYKLNYKPNKKLPVTEFLKEQGRFKHLFRPENKPMIEKIQQYVDTEWERLTRLTGSE